LWIYIICWVLHRSLSYSIVASLILCIFEHLLCLQLYVFVPLKAEILQHCSIKLQNLLHFYCFTEFLTDPWAVYSTCYYFEDIIRLIEFIIVKLLKDLISLLGIADVSFETLCDVLILNASFVSHTVVSVRFCSEFLKVCSHSEWNLLKAN